MRVCEKTAFLQKYGLEDRLARSKVDQLTFLATCRDFFSGCVSMSDILAALRTADIPVLIGVLSLVGALVYSLVQFSRRGR